MDEYDVDGGIETDNDSGQGDSCGAILTIAFAMMAAAMVIATTMRIVSMAVTAHLKTTMMIMMDIVV